MNKYIINSFLAGVATLAMTGCGENTWNDHNLDGFEGGVDYNKAVTGSYSLTSDDYEAISKLMLAKATNKADTTEARAIAKNLYFDKNGVFPASVALPAFMETATFPYYLASNGSSADVAYAECDTIPDELTAIAGAPSYKVTKDDYITAWGSDEDYIQAFAPMTPASEKLPAILKDAFGDSEAGQYAIVTYEEAAENPVFISGEIPVEEIFIEPFNENQGKFVIQNISIPEALSSVWTWGGANYGMKATGYDGTNKINYDSESWLVSPEITLGGSEANFSFDQATNFFANVETAKKEATVWVKANGSWNQITDVVYPESMGWTFVNSGEIDLSAYCGSTIQIGFKYTSTAAKAGTWEVMNFVVNAQEGTVGSNPGYAPKLQTRAVASTTDAATINAVYYYDGSKWSQAEGVTALNPSDYTAMGEANNNIKSPEVYIPLYLKNKFIYAQAGDLQFVVYNTNKVDLFVFDGTNWSLNNNGLENVVGRFTKSENVWSFTKYIGKATFNEFMEDQIMLDRSYLMVYGSVCASPIAQSDTYGYLPASNVTIDGTSIVLPSDANAFTFATSVIIDDVEYKAPEGKFLLVDSYNRYYYNYGSARPNVTTTVTTTDGAIDTKFLWSAYKNEDGAWVIENKLSEEDIRWLVYSDKYNNCALYNTISGNDHYFTLYIMD